jgi:hypothetical protein
MHMQCSKDGVIASRDFVLLTIYHVAEALCMALLDFPFRATKV